MCPFQRKQLPSQQLKRPLCSPAPRCYESCNSSEPLTVFTVIRNLITIIQNRPIPITQQKPKQPKKTPALHASPLTLIIPMPFQFHVQSLFQIWVSTTSCPLPTLSDLSPRAQGLYLSFQILQKSCTSAFARGSSHTSRDKTRMRV